MRKRKHIGQVIVSVLLLLALTLPTVIQFSHYVEGHEHRQCDEKNSHLHENELRCQICDFQLSSFNYDTLGLPDFETPNIPSEVEKHFASSILKSFKRSNNPLRAPPYFLV